MLLVTGFPSGDFTTALLADDMPDRFLTTENVTVCGDSAFLPYDGWRDSAEILWCRYYSRV